MKPKKKSVTIRSYESDRERLKAIAKAFNLPMTKAITRIIDDFQKKDR